MSEALKILNNIRTLRAQARECTLETLEEMLEKLEVVVNERREEESAAATEVEERTRRQGDGFGAERHQHDHHADQQQHPEPDGAVLLRHPAGH